MSGPAGAPRLLSAALIRRNRAARPGAGRRRAVVLGIGALILIAPWVSPVFAAATLDWLHVHLLLAGAVVAIASAMIVAQRRVLKRAEFSRSWLAALPVRGRVARWEALRIEIVPAIAAAIGFTAIVVALTLPLLFFRLSAGRGALADWAAVIGAVMLGALLSYAIPAPKPEDLPPGSRYVPLKRIKRGPVRPSFAAVGYWPVRSMFARAQPKVVARSSMLVLLSMGMGSTADTAMLALAIAAVAGGLCLLIPSLLSVSIQVRRWLAPLPVSVRRILFRLSAPTLAVIVGCGAVESLLFYAMGDSYRASIAIGVRIGVAGCLVALVGLALAQTRVKS